jgi:spoIIIJ-associated protein
VLVCGPTQARQKVDRRDRKRSEKGDKAEKAETSPPHRRQACPTAPRHRKPTAKKAGDAMSRPVSARPPRQRHPKPAAKARPASGTAGRATASTTAKPSKDSEPKEQLVDAHQVGEEAVRFMTELVSAFGLSGTAELVEDGDDLEVRVHGQELGLLVGPRGTTLQAVQDLARVAAQRRLGDHDTRLRVDVGGYRERRRAALGKFATRWPTK